MHARKKVRDHLANFMTGRTGYAVHVSRVYPIENLPAYRLYVTDDDIDEDQSSDDADMRQLSLVIECVAKATSKLEDELDEMCLQAEKALADYTAEGMVMYLTLNGTNIELDDAQEAETGQATITFDCWYETVKHDPETILQSE